MKFFWDSGRRIQDTAKAVRFSLLALAPAVLVVEYAPFPGRCRACEHARRSRSKKLVKHAVQAHTSVPISGSVVALPAKVYTNVA